MNLAGYWVHVFNRIHNIGRITELLTLYKRCTNQPVDAAPWSVCTTHKKKNVKVSNVEALQVGYQHKQTGLVHAGLHIIRTEGVAGEPNTCVCALFQGILCLYI